MLDGNMLCFKQASGFVAWLTRQSEEPNRPSVPHLLLTDPLVVKCILRNPQGLLRLPVAVVLLGEKASCAQRTCKGLWLQGLIASRDLVFAHQDVGSIVHKLANMLPQEFGTPVGRIGTVEPAPKVQHPWPSKEPVLLVYHQGSVQIALARDTRAPQLVATQAASVTTEMSTSLRADCRNHEAGQAWFLCR